MNVTAIKQQVKRQGRYSIFVDGTYAFSLSEIALLESKLSIGRELTSDELKELKQTSADDKVYNNALAYATLRLRSTWEMEQYLRRKQASAPLADQILNKLSIMGLLDDEAFARGWVANRRLLKSMSRRKLLQELRAKRVPDDIAQRAVTEDQTDEQSVLVDLIARKRRQARYRDDQKLMQYLAGQGFNYGDIKAALEITEEL
ncbi:MAG TPA: RecX family transcriptional regulator [Verrucomicrobiae bacterium]|nr:RecX family transcriptional regulator [Verrucomicrobiae bacterium]